MTRTPSHDTTPACDSSRVCVRRGCHAGLAGVAGGGAGAGASSLLSLDSVPEVLPVPELMFATPSRSDSPELELLESAASSGRVRLATFVADEGERFDAQALTERFGPEGLAGVKVAVCGPAGLVRDAVRAARSLGATEIETEDFDMRQGFGPDLSMELDQVSQRVLSRVGAEPLG